MNDDHPAGDDPALWIKPASEEDRRRAAELPLHSCPRRYCWWWRTLKFDWDIPVVEGCESRTATKLGWWRNAEVPCRRAVPRSGVDHYEPREPDLLADGFEETRFLHPEFPPE